MPGTPQDMIEQFCSILPQRLTSAILEEYGLELQPSTIQRTTQEILSLSLFWMDQAVRVTLPQELTSSLLEGISQSVRGTWTTDYELDPDEEAHFFRRMPHQHENWEKIVRQGGEPIAVLSEAVSSLEAENIIGSEDGQNLLAVFLDLVPIEEIGEMARGIEEELAG
ncbi:MAG: hypothetical protein R3351_04180 [Nitrospirales bacterium]|nr:hypothetical protein [Nitrospirales bacterium]